MKCKIRYEASPCDDRWCEGKCDGCQSCCNNFAKYMVRTLKGYEGEIKEYEIWEDKGVDRWVDIKINNRRGIHLVEDLYGRNPDFECPIAFDIIDYLEIDGKVLVGE